MCRDKLLTAREAVREVFCNKITYARLLKLIREGKIPALKLGHMYYLDSDVVIKWLEINTSTPAWTNIVSKIDGKEDIR